MILAVWFSTLNIQTVHPLQLALNRPQKAWQTVLYDGRIRTYDFYGFDCGVVCVSKEDVILVNPFDGKVKWRLSFPEDPDSANKYVKFVIQSLNRIVIDVERRYQSVQDHIFVIDAMSGRQIGAFESKKEYSAHGMSVSGDQIFLNYPKGVSSFLLDGKLLSEKSEIPKGATYAPLYLYDNALPWGKFMVNSVEIEDFPMDNGQASGLVGTKLLGPNGDDIWKGRFMRFNSHSTGLTNLDGTKATETFYPSIGLDAKGLWVVCNSPGGSHLVRILPDGTIDSSAPRPKTSVRPTWTIEGILFSYRGVLKSIRNSHLNVLGKIPKFTESDPTVTKWGMIREDILRQGQDDAKTTLRLDPIR